MGSSILIVEDEVPLRTSMVIALKRAGHAATEAGTVREARAALGSAKFDLVLTDLRLPDGDGLEVLRAAGTEAPQTPVVLITAYGSVETAVRAMKLGAANFVQKPFRPEQLLETVRLAVGPRAHSGPAAVRAEIIGESAPIQEVRARIERAAASRAVLVQGETGTGKELVARAIHAAAGDPNAPFVVVNGAGLSDSLLDSEMFGHVRGAFTGAVDVRRGLLAEADGGTLFLDEVGEIPATLQAKLLRFVQFGEVRPLGSNRVDTIRARVIAATNRDLKTEVQQQRFREDLYYRLDVFRIDVPPLRARALDLPLLSEHLLQRIAAYLGRPIPRASHEALEHLTTHNWPGNVRELENALERATLVAGSASVLLPEHFSLPSPQAGASSDAEDTLEAVERRHILSVLDQVGGDRKRAEEILGISRSTLRRKLISYGLWEPQGD